MFHRANRENPNSAAVEDEPGMPRYGWQRVAVEVDFKAHRLLPTMASAEPALMRSQSGPLASVPFVPFLTCRFTPHSPSPPRSPFPCPLAAACGCPLATTAQPAPWQDPWRREVSRWRMREMQGCGLNPSLSPQKMSV